MRTKPILIDALHINSGGALMILDHFVDKLVEKDTDFVLLKDNRCPTLRSEAKIKRIEIMSCKEPVRRQFYKDHINMFKTVLCLGNVPPPIKMPVSVHTYLHNVSLLKIPIDYSIKWKIKAFLKRVYIRQSSRNTNSWIVQTKNTADLVLKNLPCRGKQVLTYPFFHSPTFQTVKNAHEKTDYIFVGENTFAKGHTYLIDAWVEISKILGEKCPKLHLTVGSKSLIPYIDNAVRQGANIHNHGRIPFKEVIELYKTCKATVYPSLNESLGLGIIEAINMGCDVIGSDLPYLHSVCQPSETFVPRNSNSIADAVLKYERGKSIKSKLTISDKAEELIDFMNNF